jgi:hypothetical protein
MSYLLAVKEAVTTVGQEKAAARKVATGIKSVQYFESENL